MERLTTLFEQAFEKASKNGGIWLNAEGKKSPALSASHAFRACREGCRDPDRPKDRRTRV